jgi:hypothetical protein
MHTTPPSANLLSVIRRLILKSGIGFHVIRECEPAKHHAHQDGLHFGIALNLSQLQASSGLVAEIQHIDHRTHSLSPFVTSIGIRLNLFAEGKNM